MQKFFLPLISAILFIAVGCTQNKQTGINVFRYNESKGIPTLDPAFAKSQYTIWPVNQLYNGLVQMDNELNVMPAIASAWEISDDGLEYTFHIRQDVFFHDHELFGGGIGRKLTSSDVVYSLERIRDPATASPGAWTMNWVLSQDGTGTTGLDAIDDSTLIIRLNQPFPAFLGLLTMPYCSIVPEEVVSYFGQDFGQHPVGTGPFQMKLWKQGEKLILSRNENYFERDEMGKSLPYLDGVSIRFIVDKQSEFLEFLKGNIDFLSGVHPSYKDELLTRSGELNAFYQDRYNLR